MFWGDFWGIAGGAGGDVLIPAQDEAQELCIWGTGDFGGTGGTDMAARGSGGGLAPAGSPSDPTRPYGP